MGRELGAAALLTPPVAHVDHIVRLVGGTKTRPLPLVAEDGVPATFVPLAPPIFNVLHVGEMVVGAELGPLADIPVAGGLRAAAELAVSVYYVRHRVHAVRRAEGRFLALKAIDWLNVNEAKHARGRGRARRERLQWGFGTMYWLTNSKAQVNPFGVPKPLPIQIPSDFFQKTVSSSNGVKGGGGEGRGFYKESVRGKGRGRLQILPIKFPFTRVRGFPYVSVAFVAHICGGGGSYKYRIPTRKGAIRTALRAEKRSNEYQRDGRGSAANGSSPVEQTPRMEIANENLGV